MLRRAYLETVFCTLEQNTCCVCITSLRVGIEFLCQCQRRDFFDPKELGPKKWTARVWWFDSNGKRSFAQQSGFKTKLAAEERAKGKSDTGQRTSYPNAHKLTLSQFLDDWIAHKAKKLSPTTINGYNINIVKTKKSLRNILVQDLRFDMIQTFVDQQAEVVAKRIKHKPEIGNNVPRIEEIKAAPNTVKYTFRTLHSALTYAKRSGIIELNPADDIELPAERDFVPNTLDAKDALVLIEKLKACEHELYLPVLLAIMHGLCRGEALGLRWIDIDFKNGCMHICNNYTMDGNKPIEKSVKAKDSNATIPIVGFVSNELQSLRKIQQRENRVEPYVCSVGGKLPDPRRATEKLKQFQKVKGLPICRFHNLRHSFAGIALDAGTDLDTLKKLMRHSKIAVTENIYTQI